MSVEFANMFQETVLENLTGVIKQNVVYQTQIKLMEKDLQQKAELQEKYNKLILECEQLKNISQDLELYKSRADVNQSAHDEKSRIQTALNETLRKVSLLENENNTLRETIKKLEGSKKMSKKSEADTDGGTF